MASLISGARQFSWFYMARALVSVMAMGVLRTVSRWGSKAALRTQCPWQSNARQWVASGVRVFLDRHQRRTARAYTALAAMSAMTKQRREQCPPAEGEHAAAAAAAIATPTPHCPKSTARKCTSSECETQPLQWDMRHQWPWPLSKPLGACIYVAEREVLVDLKDVPKTNRRHAHAPHADRRPPARPTARLPTAVIPLASHSPLASRQVGSPQSTQRRVIVCWHGTRTTRGTAEYLNFKPQLIVG